MPLDLLYPHGAEEHLRRNYIHQVRQTINAYLPSNIFVGEALQNALDAIREGAVGHHKIEVRMDFDERSVSVRDSGLGFPDKPSLLFLGGGTKQDQGFAGMIGVGLKVILFSSEKFTLQATNADKSLCVEVDNAHRYNYEPPPDISLPDASAFPVDSNPAIEIGTGTLVEYIFPQGPNGAPSIPDLYLRDIRDDCLSRQRRDFGESLNDAVRVDAYPSRLAALIASHLRRYSYVGSTVKRTEFSRLTIEVTIRGSERTLGDLADLADGHSEVTFTVNPIYHTVADALEWARTPKPVIRDNPLGDGGTNLERTKRGFNVTTYSTPEAFELLLTNARGKSSTQLEDFRNKLFPKLNSVTLTIGRIPHFDRFCPGGSQRIISANGVVTRHSIEVTSGRNQQYVRCFDVVVEVDASLNYGKTQLTDMHLVSNVRRFINEAYVCTIQNACRKYVGTIQVEPSRPSSFWGRDRLNYQGAPLSIATEPCDENDVIALFFELAGMGIIKGFKWYGLSQSDTYDGRAIIRRESDDPDPLLRPHENDLRTIEFKLKGASIARDFDHEEKHIDIVDLVICYEVDRSPIRDFQVVNWEESALQRNEDPFPFVRSVLHDTRTSNEVQMLALRDVLNSGMTSDLRELPEDSRDAD